MYKILILEDDCLLANQIKNSLKEYNYEVSLVTSLERCQELLLQNKYDLLVFDRLINNQDSLPLIEEFRQEKYFVRILLMSCKKFLDDRLMSLKVADDFLAKPFVMAELHLKIKNLLSRSKIAFDHVQRCQDFSLADSGLLNDYVQERVVHLPKKEAKILECLLLHQNQALSYQRLLDYVWDREDRFPQWRTLNVYIRRIRNRLGPLGQRIKTLRGYGFCLDNKKEVL